MSVADPGILIGSAADRQRARILSAPVRPDPGVEIKMVAYCLTCGPKGRPARHEYVTTPRHQFNRMQEWHNKHPGHHIEFRSPERVLPKRLPKELEAVYSEANAPPWFVNKDLFRHNADVKLAYGSSAAFTFGTASLGSSTTYVAGRESTAVSNTTNLYLDYFVGGKITTGTSPTASRVILIFAYGSVDDTPTYPDVLDGTDSAETINSADILNASIKKLSQTGTNNTSDRVYWLAPTSLGETFGWLIPKNFGLYGAHDTGVNLNSTAGNHVMSYTGVYATVA